LDRATALVLSDAFRCEEQAACTATFGSESARIEVEAKSSGADSIAPRLFAPEIVTHQTRHRSQRLGLALRDWELIVGAGVEEFLEVRRIAGVWR
jgi:hypothetical protein